MWSKSSRDSMFSVPPRLSVPEFAELANAARNPEQAQRRGVLHLPRVEEVGVRGIVVSEVVSRLDFQRPATPLRAGVRRAGERRREEEARSDREHRDRKDEPSIHVAPFG